MNSFQLIDNLVIFLIGASVGAFLAFLREAWKLSKETRKYSRFTEGQ